MSKNWILQPPTKPGTWVDPTGELPPFIQRRISNPRKVQEGKFTYKHPYVRYLEEMVTWARNEHNAEFQWAVDGNNQRVINQLRTYGPQHILAMHPDFAEMVELMTPAMWNMFDRRMRDHLTAAYKAAQKIGIVRPSIAVEKALEMIQAMRPTKKDAVQSLINHFKSQSRMPRRRVQAE